MSQSTTVTIDCLDAILFVPRRSPTRWQMTRLFINLFFPYLTVIFKSNNLSRHVLHTYIPRKKIAKLSLLLLDLSKVSREVTLDNLTSERLSFKNDLLINNILNRLGVKHFSFRRFSSLLLSRSLLFETVGGKSVKAA